MKAADLKGICFVCQGGVGVVSEMTDGAFSTTVCDGCRELVTVMFHVHRDLMAAVLEAAQAKRGSKQPLDARAHMGDGESAEREAGVKEPKAFGYPLTWGDEG